MVIRTDGNSIISHHDFSIISHHDFTNDDLELYVCDDPACTSGTNQTLETTGNVGFDTSIAIGDDGNPIISHHDWGNGDLAVAIPVFTVTGIAFE